MKSRVAISILACSWLCSLSAFAAGLCDDKIVLAEKGEKAWSGIFSWYFAPSWDGIAKIYDSAGNCYKTEGQFDRAGDAFKKAAEMTLESGAPEFKYFRSAIFAYKQVNPMQARPLQFELIELLKDRKQFMLAAQEMSQYAELISPDLFSSTTLNFEDSLRACQMYQESSETYAREDKLALAAMSGEKAARGYALLGRQDLSREAFRYLLDLVDRGEGFGRNQRSGYVLDAILASLEANDFGVARRLFKAECEKNAFFKSSREAELSENLLLALEKEDLRALRISEGNFSSLLDHWRTTLLNRLKVRLSSEICP